MLTHEHQTTQRQWIKGQPVDAEAINVLILNESIPQLKTSSPRKLAYSLSPILARDNEQKKTK